MSLIHNVSVEHQIIKVSTLNSYTGNISASSTWTGTAEEVVDYTGIQIIFKADKECTLYMEQGLDGLTWEISDSWIVAADTGDARSFTSVAPYFRVRVTNNAESTAAVAFAVGISPIYNVLPRKLLEQGGLFTTTNQNVVADPLNSTETPLNYTDIFTGEASSTLGIVGIQISMKADQNAIVYVDQSPDGTNWDITDNFYYYTTKSFGVTVQAVNSYYRVRIYNSSPGQGNMTYMRFQTALCPMVEAVPRSLDAEQNFKVSIRDMETSMGHVIMGPMGALKTGETTKLVGHSFIGTTFDGNFWVLTATGSGAVSQAAGELTLDTVGGINSGSLVQSFRTARYVAAEQNYFRSNLRAPSVTTASAGYTCTRRWGAFDVNDGFFFEIYQISGSDPLFRIVSRKSGTDSQIDSGYFNGDLGAEYVLNTSVHTYEIWWNNKSIYFFIDGILLHTLTATTVTLSSVLSLKIGFQVQNGGGNTAANTLITRSGTINRLGKMETSPIWKYISGALAITILKYGGGRLHRVVVNQASGTSVSLYDALSATNPIAIIDPAKTTGTLSYDLDFYTGLSVVTVGAAINVTIVYE